MIIILCLYVVALWLVFAKFKIVRWGWLSGTVAVLAGVFILATFLALFNYLTPSGRVTIVGMFSQNGFQTIKDGAPVDIVFDNAPGRIYHAKIKAIPKGVGQGQIAVSGTLARTTALGGAMAFPAEITIPKEMDRESLRLGMSGSATAFADNAGVIGLLASILVWVSSYTAYL